MSFFFFRCFCCCFFFPFKVDIYIYECFFSVVVFVFNQANQLHQRSFLSISRSRSYI